MGELLSAPGGMAVLFAFTAVGLLGLLGLSQQVLLALRAQRVLGVVARVPESVKREKQLDQVVSELAQACPNLHGGARQLRQVSFASEGRMYAAMSAAELLRLEDLSAPSGAVVLPAGVLQRLPTLLLGLGILGMVASAGQSEVFLDGLHNAAPALVAGLSGWMLLGILGLAVDGRLQVAHARLVGVLDGRLARGNDQALLQQMLSAQEASSGSLTELTAALERLVEVQTRAGQDAVRTRQSMDNLAGTLQDALVGAIEDKLAPTLASISTAGIQATQDSKRFMESASDAHLKGVERLTTAVLAGVDDGLSTQLRATTEGLAKVAETQRDTVSQWSAAAADLGDMVRRMDATTATMQATAAALATAGEPAAQAASGFLSASATLEQVIPRLEQTSGAYDRSKAALEQASERLAQGTVAYSEAGASLTQVVGELRDAQSHVLEEQRLSMQASLQELRERLSASTEDLKREVDDSTRALRQNVDSNRKGLTSGVEEMREGFRAAVQETTTAMRRELTEGGAELRAAHTESAEVLRLAHLESADALRKANSESAAELRAANAETAEILRATATAGALELRAANTEGAEAMRQAHAQSVNELRDATVDAVTELREATRETSIELRGTTTQALAELRGAHGEGVQEMQAANRAALEALSQAQAQAVEGLGHAQANAIAGFRTSVDETVVGALQDAGQALQRFSTQQGEGLDAWAESTQAFTSTVQQLRSVAGDLREVSTGLRQATEPNIAAGQAFQAAADSLQLAVPRIEAAARAHDDSQASLQQAAGAIAQGSAGYLQAAERVRDLLVELRTAHDQAAERISQGIDNALGETLIRAGDRVERISLAQGKQLEAWERTLKALNPALGGLQRTTTELDGLVGRFNDAARPAGDAAKAFQNAAGAMGQLVPKLDQTTASYETMNQALVRAARQLSESSRAYAEAGHEVAELVGGLQSTLDRQLEGNRQFVDTVGQATEFIESLGPASQSVRTAAVELEQASTHTAEVVRGLKDTVIVQGKAVTHMRDSAGTMVSAMEQQAEAWKILMADMDELKSTLSSGVETISVRLPGAIDSTMIHFDAALAEGVERLGSSTERLREAMDDLQERLDIVLNDKRQR